MSNPNPRKGRLDIGPLSPRGTNTHYTPQSLTFATPTRVCSATVPSSQPLELNKLWQGSAVRPGANDHAKFRSRGTGC